MGRGKLRFSEREATRLIRAAVKAGVQVGRVEVDRDNKIAVIAEPQKQQPKADEGDKITQNEWDAPPAWETQQ